MKHEKQKLLSVLPPELKRPWGFYFPEFVAHIKGMSLDEIKKALADERARLSQIVRICARGTVGDYWFPFCRLDEYLTNGQILDPVSPHEATLYLELLQGLVDTKQMPEDCLEYFLKASVPPKR